MRHARDRKSAIHTRPSLGASELHSLKELQSISQEARMSSIFSELRPDALSPGNHGLEDAVFWKTGISALLPEQLQMLHHCLFQVLLCSN
jgi:hypothetical protein